MAAVRCCLDLCTSEAAVVAWANDNRPTLSTLPDDLKAPINRAVLDKVRAFRARAK